MFQILRQRCYVNQRMSVYVCLSKHVLFASWASQIGRSCGKLMSLIYTIDKPVQLLLANPSPLRKDFMSLEWHQKICVHFTLIDQSFTIGPVITFICHRRFARSPEIKTFIHSLLECSAKCSTSRQAQGTQMLNQSCDVFMTSCLIWLR